MSDLELLVRQVTNSSIIKIQQRTHNEVVALGKLAMQWRESAENLQLALNIEREAREVAENNVAVMSSALKEVIKALESDNPAIVDTIWVSTGQPETLRDHCHHAILVIYMNVKGALNNANTHVGASHIQPRRPSPRRLLSLARMGRNAAQSRVTAKAMRTVREVEISAGIERHSRPLRDAKPQGAGDFGHTSLQCMCRDT